MVRPASVALPGGSRTSEGNYSYADAGAAADRATERDSPPRESQQTATSLLPFAGLALAIVTSIFYVFPAGTPQPGDAMLAITIVATILLANHTMPDLSRLYLTLGSFLV